MQVAGDGVRRDAQQAAQALLGGDQVAVGGGILEVAEMLREHRLIAAGEAQHRLEVAAHRQHRPRAGRGQRDGIGHEAAGPAHGYRARIRRQQHAVVDGPGDGPVVHQEGVGDAVQPYRRIIIVGAQRFPGGIAGRHDQGRHARHGGEQQVVDRCIREHHADEIRPRRHLRAEAGSGTQRGADDGCGG